MKLTYSADRVFLLLKKIKIKEMNPRYIHKQANNEWKLPRVHDNHTRYKHGETRHVMASKISDNLMYTCKVYGETRYVNYEDSP